MLYERKNVQIQLKYMTGLGMKPGALQLIWSFATELPSLISMVQIAPNIMYNIIFLYKKSFNLLFIKKITIK